MVLVIDNYDSFTYNLVQYFGELGAEVHVVRNDAASVDDVAATHPERVIEAEYEWPFQSHANMGPGCVPSRAWFSARKFDPVAVPLGG